MKRKLSFLVAATMVLSMLPAMGVSAATDNSILVPGGTVTSDFEWAGDPGATPVIFIEDKSKNPVLMGGTSSFMLTLENAEFDTDALNVGAFTKSGPGSSEWNVSAQTLTVPNGAPVFVVGPAPASYPAPVLSTASTEAGYTMEIVGPSVAQISNILTAAAVADDPATVGVDETVAAVDSLSIPLPVKMKGTGPAKVTIGGVGSASYTEGTYTFAVGADGTTTASIKDSKTTFASKLTVPDITVSETVPNTMKLGETKQTIKFTAPNGFEWSFAKNNIGANTADGPQTVTPYSGFTATAGDLNEFLTVDSKDEQVAIFDLSAAAAASGASGITAQSTLNTVGNKPGSLIFSKMTLIKSGSVSETPVGPVSIKVSVSNGGTHTIVVGEFAKKAVSLTAEDKALPEIISGIYSDDPMDEDTQVLDVTIKESSVGAWNANNDATFTLPDGVKFRGVEVKKADNVIENLNSKEVQIIKLANIKSDKEDTTGILSGTTYTGYIKLEDDLLSIKAHAKTGERMEIKLRCYVTVKPGFTGDIVFKTDEDNEAFGGDLSVVVGKAINPFTVTATTKDVQLGYMNIPLGDITIKENQAGALKKSGAYGGGFTTDADDIELFIGGYSGGGVGFKEKGTYEVLSGDIVVDKTELDESILKLIIKRESSTASEIKLSGMTMDANRSVPEGKLELRIAGSVVGNYYGSPVAVADGKDMSTFDVEYFVAKPDYVNIITAAPDKDTKYTTEVAAVVGGKSITANGVEFPLEVAPFNKDGYVMVPTRAVAVALGLKDEQILWNGTTKEVTILDTNRNRTSQFTQGSNVIKQAGISIGFEGPSCQNVEGRTFLPFRALGEIVLGCPVSWDQATQTAYFNKGAGGTPVATPAATTPAPAAAAPTTAAAQ